VDAEVLRPLVRQIVAEVVAQLEHDRAQIPDGPLAYSEEEAARLLGLEPHVLRDERRRGKIGASRIVGRRVRYTREDLTGYLAGRRTSSGVQ
jgi:excisionase family DNA binding protein